MIQLKNGIMVDLDYEEIDKYMRSSGAKIIARKGCTNHAIAVSVCSICEYLFGGVNTVATVATMLHGEYGLDDVCLSLPVLLGHVWALIYGLGVGLGKLPKDDPLHAVGAARLTQARELRNQLRAELGAATPEQPAAFDLPTAMDSPASIREAWGLLEVHVLNSYARLVAADSDPRWRIAMRNQVQPVQATGTALTWWPGWLA